ncbi:MAG: hypothetical protein HC869_19750 [Rhodospirillales bacterium]|nr:hypothetical protein [Rhodospirillales bacterium]
MLAGCAMCSFDDYVTTGPPKSETRSARQDRGAPVAHAADPKTKPVGPERTPILKPGNQVRFVLLQDTEVGGRSRSYTGEQLDPNSCAERCLANTTCGAFSFDKETKICYLISQLTELNSNPAFVSGRLR